MEASPRYLHARALYQAVVDGVSQIDVSVHAAECLQVAKSGEADIEIALGINERFQRAVLQRLSQHLFIEVRAASEDVRVPIDEPGQNGRVGEIEHLITRRDVHVIR